MPGAGIASQRLHWCAAAGARPATTASRAWEAGWCWPHALHLPLWFCSYRVDIYDSANQLVSSTTVTETTATKTGLAAGVYAARVAAVNVNSDAGPEASTGPLIVGRPGKLAAAPTVAGGIGSLTLTWQKPAVDPSPASTEFFAKVRRGAVWATLWACARYLPDCRCGLQGARSVCCPSCKPERQLCFGACRSTTPMAPPWWWSASRWWAPLAKARQIHSLPRPSPCRLACTRWDALAHGQVLWRRTWCRQPVPYCAQLTHCPAPTAWPGDHLWPQREWRRPRVRPVGRRHGW